MIAPVLFIEPAAEVRRAGIACGHCRQVVEVARRFTRTVPGRHETRAQVQLCARRYWRERSATVPAQGEQVTA